MKYGYMGSRYCLDVHVTYIPPLSHTLSLSMCVQVTWYVSKYGCVGGWVRSSCGRMCVGV